jgi:hypothetical protein
LERRERRPYRSREGASARRSHIPIVSVLYSSSKFLFVLRRKTSIHHVDNRNIRRFDPSLAEILPHPGRTPETSDATSARPRGTLLEGPAGSRPRVGRAALPTIEDPSMNRRSVQTETQHHSGHIPSIPPFPDRRRADDDRRHPSMATLGISIRAAPPPGRPLKKSPPGSRLLHPSPTSGSSKKFLSASGKQNPKNGFLRNKEANHPPTVDPIRNVPATIKRDTDRLLLETSRGQVRATQESGHGPRRQDRHSLLPPNLLKGT